MKQDLRYWQARLFKEARGGHTHVDTNYSVRIAYGGRRERFQLGTANKYEAAAKGRAIYLALVANGWAATLARFKAAPKRAPEGGRDDRRVPCGAPGAPCQQSPDVGRLCRRPAHDRRGGRGVAPRRPRGKPEAHRLWRERVDAVKLSAAYAGPDPEVAGGFPSRAPGMIRCGNAPPG